MPELRICRSGIHFHHCLWLESGCRARDVPDGPSIERVEMLRHIRVTRVHCTRVMPGRYAGVGVPEPLGGNQNARASRPPTLRAWLVGHVASRRPAPPFDCHVEPATKAVIALVSVLGVLLPSREHKRVRIVGQVARCSRARSTTKSGPPDLRCTHSAAGPLTHVVTWMGFKLDR